MSSAFVSKNRKVHFALGLRIIDLNNVPLVTGTTFIKWHIPSSTAAEHRGRTHKCAIREHRVQYEYEKQTRVRLIVAKDGVLEEVPIVFEILQEYSAGGRGERITLGHIKLNLAEYVNATSDVPSPSGGGGGATTTTTTTTPTIAATGTDGAAPDEGITRRYLMQDSKINSTLKLGVTMRYLEGTRDYTAPPLRTAPVFGGIAGIMSSAEPVASAAAMGTHLLGGGGGGASTTSHGANGVGGDGGGGDGGDGTQDGEGGANSSTAWPNGAASNKELGEMQDMYRRTLAAYWASQPGELKADECIEDIFAGGDGWGKHGRPASQQQHHHHHHHHHHQQQQQHHHDGGGSGGGRSSRPASSASTPLPESEGVAAVSHVEGTQSTSKRGLFSSLKYHKPRGPRKSAGEVDEMDARDDLTSWRTAAAVS